jgi:prophage DNA circulation protein
MAYLGDKGFSEEIPIVLTLDAAPTGTPQYRILNSSRTEIVAATNLSGSGLLWYKTGQNTSADTIGSYEIEYTAVISGVTRYAYDHFDVTEHDADDVKTDTAAILVDTGTTLPATLTTIEGKIDIIDANLDTVKDTDLPAVKTDTAAILTDTGTTLPGTLTTIEGKIDIIDTVVDSIQVDVDTLDTDISALITDTGMDGDSDTEYA